MPRWTNGERDFRLIFDIGNEHFEMAVQNAKILNGRMADRDGCPAGRKLCGSLRGRMQDS
ncbi:uncharacterized protein FOMMEDRAFT_158660 [Fomitiporia mediterranea MF3/22]|uniref:uncharacterized protein n=1 Tax=Fomitiporia mediterranea (strain MF3/22) TaxID=694068 RepID=UPI0004408D22|nr:uncharacterized protein FOMMEDRAFT_158660 [Fomitiporia mediterranea MF3/22]EJD01509.1 hypothetical protein FOMMEDRAFT_158660 [Fomitiporia mediterranea MF3/22]